METGVQGQYQTEEESTEQGRLTTSQTIETLGFLQETIDLVHLLKGEFVPAFFLDNTLDLFTHRFRPFGVGGETE